MANDLRGNRDLDGGSATIWTLGAAALILLLAVVALTRGSAVLARHRVERAADLSALAAANQIGRAGDPCQAAARLAQENGARLDDCAVVLGPSGRTGTVAVWLSGRIRLPMVGDRVVAARSRAGRVRMG